MAIAPTLDLFGQNIVTVVLQTTDAFNGTDHPINMSSVPTNPVLNPGRADFAPQSGGGNFDFHTVPGGKQIVVRHIVASVSTDVYIVYPDLLLSPAVKITTISSGGIYDQDIFLSPGEYLQFKSSAPGFVAVTAELSGPERLTA